MSKKYFKSFDFIKQADGAKSLSFFTTKSNGILSKELYDEFTSILKNDEERFRISLHTSSEDDLHNMIIGMKKSSLVEPHKHKKSESYHIIKGKMLLVYFNEDGSIDKKIIMSLNDTIVSRVNGGYYHGVIALEDTIYHESRLGPFISATDSEFATFCLNKIELLNEM